MRWLLALLVLTTLPSLTVAQSAGEVESAMLKEDPNYLTKVPQITLKARSQGGKSRFEPWRTYWGSYWRIDKSNRQYECTIQSVSRFPQRVRVQCFLISRNYGDRGVDVTMLDDVKVTIQRLSVTTMGAWSELTSTDESYLALGSRDKTGDKYLGWTWRAIDGNGKICAVVSSASAYDRYAKEQPLNPTKVAVKPESARIPPKP